jgi:ABC-type multidrug transport system ATPase subunit
MSGEIKDDDSPSDRIPLVKLKIQNITYQPQTDGYSPNSPSRSTFSLKKKQDDSSISMYKPVSRKIILNNVTPPEVEPFKLSAWMGPSGSGKTSLLSIAAGMTAYDSDSFGDDSKITINNDRHNLLSKKGGFPKGLAGIVWQDDLLLSNLTVRETIAFSAKLKTPRSEMHRVPGMVDGVLNDLGLTNVQHSLIGQSLGGPGRGISGGERKRVSVATELVSRPSIIFLDEPTSGLDSTSAYELMVTLKELARKGGHSIVTVIHQPRTTIFDLFDGLLLLSKGQEVYSGPANLARQVLESCPIIGTPLPAQTNIADWIMDMIIKDENRYKLTHVEDEESSPSSGRQLPLYWESIRGTFLNHETQKSSISVTTGNRSMHKLSSLAEIRNSIPKYTASFATQLRMLTIRAIKQTRGEKISNAAILATTAYTAFESLFWLRLPDDTNHIYERNSLIFFLIIAQGNGIVISSVPIFRRDRSLLTRERSKKMYRVLPYFLAKTLAGESKNEYYDSRFLAVVLF